MTNVSPEVLLIALGAAGYLVIQVGFFVTGYGLRDFLISIRDRAAQPHLILSAEDLDRYEKALPSLRERDAWRVQITRIREATGGAVRQAHLDWHDDVRRGRAPIDLIPLFDPPSWLGYRLDTDPGTPAVLDYQRALRAGAPLGEKLATLRELADHGSDIALVELGAALLNPDFEVADRDDARREGRKHMETACRRGNPYALNLLGLILLQGKALPADTATGLAMLRAAVARKHVPAIIILAWILARGKYGVPVDLEEAAEIAVVDAAAYRRWLLKLGARNSAREWRDILLEGFDVRIDSKQNISFADPHRAPRRLNPIPPNR